MAENKYQYSYQYPHPAVTTDCVVFGYDVAPEDRESKKKNKRMALQVLLIERACVGLGVWCRFRQFRLEVGIRDHDNSVSPRFLRIRPSLEYRS